MTPHDSRFVTHHAVCRYCERILRIELSGEYANERKKAQAYARKLNTSVRNIRDQIWTKGLKIASSMRLSHFANKQFSATLDAETGVVLTIALPKDAKPPRLRILSKKEMRQKGLREMRRKLRVQDSQLFD